MKYIPGTKFINKTSKHTKFFKKGQLYVLYNIKRKDNKMIYTFKVNRELIEVPFETTEQADEWLKNIEY